MSVLRSSYFIPSLLCFIFLSELRFGTSLSLGDISKLSRREALARFPVATIILPVLLDIVPSRAHAAGFQDDLRSSLKPDSDDQPRIPLPTGQDPQSETTVVEGLLSLKNPRSEIRPAASDIVLLTVRDVKQPDVILAGAKLPVSRIRFPLRFRLSTSNLINTANVIAIWKESANQHDLLVQAVVCSESSTTASTTSTCNARFRAQGVAKLIRLQESEVTIRSAVSLPLE